MATLPTVGGSDGAWGAQLNAFLEVGHDADGTHKKSQMLTDMGWSPTAYAGEESITHPNGLIEKSGYKARTGDTTAVTFAEAFPNELKSIQVTPYHTVQGGVYTVFVSGVTVDGFSINEQTGYTGYYWTARGR